MSRLLVPVAVLAAALASALVISEAPIAVVVCLLIAAAGAGRSLARRQRWGPADDITTLRLGLIIVFTALVLADAERGFSWPAVAVGALALALDASDGLVARKTAATAAGADYDETVDALFVLILSLALVPLWGPWCVLPGLLHYLFRAGAALRPAWRHPLPPSWRRKIIAAAQGILLLTAGSPPGLATPWFGVICAGAALVSLIWSFALDIAWLERRARSAGHSAERSAGHSGAAARFRS